MGGLTSASRWAVSIRSIKTSAYCHQPTSSELTVQPIPNSYTHKHNPIHCTQYHQPSPFLPGPSHSRITHQRPSTHSPLRHTQLKLYFFPCVRVLTDLQLFLSHVRQNALPSPTIAHECV
ncbi:hypothetical protein DL98DRAFT_125845 [Cadophora sp. DSE1049]|nr:hypothetical protein DL98DRAFT_125845 [Cadophora sp. DSE1049]